MIKLSILLKGSLFIISLFVIAFAISSSIYYIFNSRHNTTDTECVTDKTTDMSIEEIRNYDFGCTDSCGDNGVNETFRNNILPVLEKYNMSAEDLKTITDNISVMCLIAFENGEENEAYNNGEW